MKPNYAVLYQTMKDEGIMDKFAVIDTETNWNDEEMSIGVVVADF